jgi:hypothetical protein
VAQDTLLTALFCHPGAQILPRFEINTPANAPNVLIILIDDMGFGQSSAFDGR